MSLHTSASLRFGLLKCVRLLSVVCAAKEVSLYPAPSLTAHQVHASVCVLCVSVSCCCVVFIAVCVGVQAAVRDYYVRPLLDYSSVQQVKGPLVILDNVKVCVLCCVFLLYVYRMCVCCVCVYCVVVLFIRSLSRFLCSRSKNCLFL